MANLWLEDNGLIQIDRRHLIRVSLLGGTAFLIGDGTTADAASIGSLLSRLARFVVSVVLAITLKNFKRSHPEYASQADQFMNELRNDKLIDTSSVYSYPSADPPRPSASLRLEQFGSAFAQTRRSYSSSGGFYFSGEDLNLTKAAFFNVSPQGNRNRTTIMGPSLSAVVEAASTLRTRYSPADTAKILLPNRPVTNFRRTFEGRYEDPDVYYTNSGTVKIAYSGVVGRQEPVRDKKGRLVGYAGVGTARVSAIRSDNVQFLDQEYKIPAFRAVR
jgi:hypothetical protein